MKKLLIAIDFHGTIVESKFPEIGEFKPHAVRIMKALIEQGHKLILNTCREDCRRRKYLQEAVDACKKAGIEFRSINENHCDDDFRDTDYKRRKIYAHYYIDDRNFQAEIDWLVIGRHFGIEDAPV